MYFDQLCGRWWWWWWCWYNAETIYHKISRRVREHISTLVNSTRLARWISECFSLKCLFHSSHSTRKARTKVLSPSIPQFSSWSGFCSACTHVVYPSLRLLLVMKVNYCFFVYLAWKRNIIHIACYIVCMFTLDLLLRSPLVLDPRYFMWGRTSRKSSNNILY